MRDELNKPDTNVLKKKNINFFISFRKKKQEIKRDLDNNKNKSIR